MALGLGLAGLAVAWRLAAPGTPPLYDGPVVVAPYRYVCIPEGYQQAHPAGPTTQQVKVTNGAVEGGGVFVTTDEAPLGQVQVLVNGEDMALAAGATTVTVTITPIEPPAQLPADGRLNGNVVTVALASGGQPVTLKAGKQWTVVLRGPTGAPTSVIEQFNGTAWASLQTQPVGQPDVYAGNSTTFGTFALVIPGTAGTAGPCRTFDRFGASASPVVGGTGTVTDGSSGTPAGGGGSAGTGGDSGSGPIIVAALLGGLILVGLGVFIVRARSRNQLSPPPSPSRRPGGSGRGSPPRGRRRG